MFHWELLSVVDVTFVPGEELRLELAVCDCVVKVNGTGYTEMITPTTNKHVYCDITTYTLNMHSFANLIMGNPLLI